MYGLVGQGIVVLFPAIARYINLLQVIQTGSGAHQILSNGYRGVITLGMKWLGGETGYSPALKAELKNTWIYISVVLYVLENCLIKDRNTFTFTSYIL
jgi:hypothetical protein